MKKSFWKTDWFVALIVSLLFLFAASSDPMQSLERKAYDLGVKSSNRAPGDKIAVIAIDDQSIKNIGRLPWSRDVHAKMFDILAKAKAKVIANTVYFIEPQIDPGLVYIKKIDTFVASSTIPTTSPDAPALDAMLKQAEIDLNSDAKLSNSIKAANNVVLAMPFTIGEPLGNPDKPLPAYVSKNALTNLIDRVGAENAGLLPIPTVSAFSPIPAVGEAASAIGHLNAIQDVDGTIRVEPLVLSYYKDFYPSLSLQIAAKYLNLKPQDIEVRLGEGIKLGKLNIVTDSALAMNTFFYGEQAGRPAFAVDSFFDVLSGKIPAEKYQGKIVLIGMGATGDGGDAQVTPISSNMKPIETLAHSVASILNEDFFVSPSWSIWVERAVWLLVALYLIVLFPRLKAGTAAMVTLLIFVALIATHFVLMTQQATWLQLMMPAALLVVGHALLTTKRFLLTEKGKARSEAESAESNRNLALMFQSQGQLDMAYDRLRKCPMDNNVMDALYNLALDFERKRQFNKAESVFSYMSEFNPKYKDLEQKLARSKAMAETVVLGGSGGKANASMIVDGAMEKPMLGRYQIEKELGKGAMGVVYLGKDPKIGRTVAIKTMALAQEFEPDELEEVKARFFREAETAGRLNHPNIVTMYDAGEEHDLAYIAMEFLKGKDLGPYVKPDTLLSVDKVVNIVLRVAEALNYAHAQGVVHRDIKPANIMYEMDSASVKVTDFGIARITDSSKTKTGMVLGTPSYMSPEQLSGKKVDGRSDLFSLGVMFYQLTTGKLPFVADSMAALMFKIANEPHVSAREVNDKLSPAISYVIDRMLDKDADKRYQNGGEIVSDLRDYDSQMTEI